MSRSSRTSKADPSSGVSIQGLRSLPEQEALWLIAALRRKMRTNKWPVGKLAEEAGIDRSTLRRWLSSGVVSTMAAQKVELKLGLRGAKQSRHLAHTSFGAIGDLSARVRSFLPNEVERISAAIGECALSIQRTVSLRGTDCGVIIAPCKATRAVIELRTPLGRFAVELEAGKRNVLYRLVKGERSEEELAGVGELTARGAFFCVAFLLEAPRNQAGEISRSFQEKNQLRTLY